MAQTDRLAGINQTALDFVGLGPQVIAQFAAESAAQEARALEKARTSRVRLLDALDAGANHGAVFYTGIRAYLDQGRQRARFDFDNPLRTIHLPGNLASFDVSIDVKSTAQVPDNLEHSWKYAAKRRAMEKDDSRWEDPEIAGRAAKYIVHFLDGFATAAFEAHDWAAAVNAADIITDGGLLNSQWLRNVATTLPIDINDITDRVDLATAISQRLEHNAAKAQEEAERPERWRQREFGLIASRINKRGQFPDMEARYNARKFVEATTKLPNISRVIGVKNELGAIQRILVVTDESPNIDPQEAQAAISALTEQIYPGSPNIEMVIHALTVQELQQAAFTDKELKLFWRRIDAPQTPETAN